MNISVKEMGKDTTLTIRVEPALKERLETVAKQLKRSKSYVVEEAIEEFVAVQEWQVARIEQALQSMKEGKRIAHDEVVRWVESWGTDNELPIPKV